ncbi:small ribosomal subunit Rsm22 family protein [Alloiococcus sp. CFN-8]|uniref:small ribosomal subunit Rsm22 family protein n=1 Tax=Alloiococcus sp. CFN-8 TaxID=3416081 RepID=UPI003CE6B673
MELPYNLKNAIEVMTADVPVSALIKTSENITKKYRNESGRGKRLIVDDQEALVYSIVRMPATYSSISSVLKYVFEYNAYDIKTVLDVGAGTGAATWAIMEAIDDVEMVTCIEREEAMIKLGKALMEEEEFYNRVSWINSDACNMNLSENYDLIIASYALNELTESDRERVVNNLWNHANKLLVIIEPGTPVGFSHIKIIRNNILKEVGNIIAPCPHSKACPMEEDNWCHFSCRVSRTKLHKLLKGGDVPYEDEKYSYVAFSKESSGLCDSRILRHPIIETGRVTLELCTDSGLESKTVTKKQKELYKAARKSKWGDSFPVK